MSNQIQNNNTNSNQSDGSSNPDNQQNAEDVKLLTQAEYLKYKQQDSNTNNYYGFSREVDVKPVAWDGKFAAPDPNNFFIVPNRNASNVQNFYGFDKTPSVSPVVWDGTFVKSGETRLQQERNRSDDRKYF